MWGQGQGYLQEAPGDDGSESPEDVPPAVIGNGSVEVATAAKTERVLMNKLEDEMQHVLGGMTDAFSVNIPFTEEDKKRIVDNLNAISQEHEGEDLDFTRAVLVYMLKELREVFGYPDAFEEAERKMEAADVAEAKAAHEGESTNRKRRRTRGPVKT